MHASAENASPSVLNHRQPQSQASDSCSGSSWKVPADIERSYQAIACDPKYRHFVRIPARIIRCLDYFGIACDRAATVERLRSYYLFIGVVDDAIDSGQIGAGNRTLDYFGTQSPSFTGESRTSNVKLVTEILKCHIDDESYSLMTNKFRELYQEVVSERNAASIHKYVEDRRAVGRLTAELSYLLIRPLLRSESESLSRFMKRVGEVGCLVDSVIDLRSDHRLDLLGFAPGLVDYAKLAFCTLRDGARLSLKHPALFGLFLQAIVDNFHDRIGRNQPCVRHGIVSQRKDKAAIVA
jgi:hypothetical protein